MTRVLHVAEAFGGGLMEMVRLVAEQNAARGSAQAVAYGRRPETPADPRRLIDRRVELFGMDWGGRSLGTEVRAARTLRRLVADWRPDVVHLHSSFAGVVGMLALRGRVPLIFTPHAFPSQLGGRARATRTAFAAVETLIVRGVDLVGAVSQSEAALARGRGARAQGRKPKGIPELDAERPAAARRTRRVIAGGRLVGQRRPEACARILAAVADVAEVAWVGGGGAEREVTEAAHAALRAAGIPMTGWVPRARMLEELSASLAYLHWTSWDGMPLSVLEAMACDTVVVASDIAPNRELLDPRQLCRTEREAVALLRRVVADEVYAEELRADQRRRRPAHSAARMAASWYSRYGELAAGSAVRTRSA